MIWILFVLAAIIFASYIIIEVATSVAGTNAWIKSPMTSEERDLAVECNIFDGDIDEIIAHQLEAKQELYLIEKSSDVYNEGFTYSLCTENDYFCFFKESTARYFTDVLLRNDVLYYAHHSIGGVLERANNFDIYDTVYYIKVKPEDAEKAYALFYEADIDGDRYRYYIENGEEVRESF